MTYHYHGIDAEESILIKSLPNLGTWALPNLFFIFLWKNKRSHTVGYVGFIAKGNAISRRHN